MKPMTLDESTTNDHLFFKNTVVMSKLQEMDVMLGKCPSCQTNKLRHGYEGGGMAFRHCDKCTIIWVLSSNAGINGAPTASPVE